MKKLINSKITLFLFIIMASVSALAGLHAYTHHLRVHALLFDLIYYSEVGSSFVGITLG